MNNADVVKSMEILDAWLEESGKKLHGINAEGLAARQKVAVSLLQLSQEHALAIAKLIHANLVGSALALLRSQFESNLRGWWLAKCATDEWFQKEVVDKKDFPSGMKKRMLEEIEKKYPENEYQLFLNHAAQTKKLYDDFTHGGYSQLARRFDGNGSIVYGSRNLEIYSIIKSAFFYDGLAKVVTVEVMNRLDVASDLEEVFRESHAAFPKFEQTTNV